MKRLTEILKRHVWCVIIIAAIILLSLITLSFCEDVNLVSHLSLGSAIVSIVLAIIVIVYMYFQDQRSSQNITEMRSLIDQGTRMMTEKADIMVDRAETIGRQLGIMKDTPTDGKTITPPLEIKEPWQLDISVYGFWGLLALYSLAKSNESGKPMSWEKMASLFSDNSKINIDIHEFSAVVNCGFGIIQTFGAFLGREAATWSYDQQEAKKLPDGLKESVTDQIEKELKRFKNEGNARVCVVIETSRDVIDEYFDKL